MDSEKLARQLGYQLLGPINKGWSDDRKFLLQNDAGQRFVLRCASQEKFAQKQQEYHFIRRLNQMGLPMSQAVLFGRFEDSVYMVLSWVQGEDLRENLHRFSEQEQYQLGVQASRLLKKIHSLPIQEDEQTVASACRAKMEKKLQQLQIYEAGEIRMPGDEQVIRYVREHCDCLCRRRAVMAHGDFHSGNLILTPQNTVAVIDFNRFRLGDPYEEFYKLELFDVEASIPFAAGRLDGYFDGRIPADFWQAQKVYVAHTILYSIHWAIPFGQADVEGMKRRYHVLFDSYEGFTRNEPRWYTDYINR